MSDSLVHVSLTFAFHGESIEGKLTDQDLEKATQNLVTLGVPAEACPEATKAGFVPAGSKDDWKIEGLMTTSPPANGCPVAIVLLGTRMPMDSVHALHLVKELANRGFCAALLEYNNGGVPILHHDLGALYLDLKLKQVFAGVDALLAKVGDANADRGVVMVGISQGGMMALRSKNVDDRVTRALSLTGAVSALSPDPALTVANSEACLGHAALRLGAENRRIWIGESDNFAGNGREQIAEMCGKSFPPSWSAAGLQPDGSGFVLIPDAEDGGKADHFFYMISKKGFPERMGREEEWGVKANMDWLAKGAKP